MTARARNINIYKISISSHIFFNVGNNFLITDTAHRVGEKWNLVSVQH